MAVPALVPGSPAEKETISIDRSRAPKLAGDRFARTFCLVCAAISIITTLGIILVLGTESFAFFRKVSPIAFFTGTEWTAGFANPKYGVLPLVTGTLLITVGAAIIAIPLGLLSAIYLSEYAQPRTRAILKPALELLAGIPTVVYGFFALETITPALKTLFPVDQFNAASGAIVVGVMILPLVSSLCEDALRAVPQTLRDGAYAMGATRAEVTMKTVVPAALSGIMAAFILALSRAIGETMAVSIAAGQKADLTLNPARSIETMTAFIVRITKGDNQNGTTEFQTLFAVGATLFVITLLMNLLAQRLVKRLRQTYD